ncbi:hypothetical protein IFR05_006591 [Cadophora sp. M221]|nr:hypothetical protein IFR05_006591 [Cadophora sp. M221]
MTSNRDMWESLTFEVTTGYLEDDEDYVVISIDKKTGVITQQYEYEYYLDKFLEHLSSLSNFPAPEDSLQRNTTESLPPILSSSTAESLGLWTGNIGKLKRLGIRLDGKDEKESEEAGSTRSSSPHTDVDFRDLDAISDPESNSRSWSTYTDTGENIFPDMILERIPSSHEHRMELEIGLDGAPINGERAGEKRIQARHRNEGEAESEPRGEGDTDLGDEEHGDYIERGRPGKSKAVVLAATVHAVLIACLWVMESRSRE